MISRYASNSERYLDDDILSRPIPFTNYLFIYLVICSSEISTPRFPKSAPRYDALSNRDKPLALRI